jgi:hypothetical protein
MSYSEEEFLAKYFISNVKEGMWCFNKFLDNPSSFPPWLMEEFADSPHS